MHTTHRGFIPLVAIILLGLVAVAGGTIATVSMRSSGQKPAVVTDQATTTPSLEAYSAPVSTRVASSTPTTRVEEVEVSARLVTPDLSPEAISICNEVLQEPDPGKPSLLRDEQTLCKELQEVEPDTPEQRERWSELENSLLEKHDLYMNVKKSEESSEERQRQIENGTR